jgi:hypothetical protein
MNEIRINNGENLSEEIENLKNDLEKSIKNIELIKDLYKKEEQDKFENLFYEDSKSDNIIKFKKGYINAHITLFIPIFQFLDIKSFLEFSRVNRLFHSFIFSFYFYRSVNQVLIFSKKKYNLSTKHTKNKKEKNHIININNTNIDTNPQEDQNILLGQTKKIYSSVMSAITGVFNYMNPTSELNQGLKGEKDELKEIEKKIELHDKLIDGRIQQLKIYKEIDNINNQIEIYIRKKNKLKNKKVNNVSIKNIEKEKYEKEYNNLIKEIKEIENKFNEIKKDNETQNKIGIELDDKINKIKFHAKNALK